MPIRFEQIKEEVGLVTLQGDLRGAEEAAALRDAVATAAAVRTLVIDFSQAHFVDSQGLETLLWSRGRLGDMIDSVRIAGLDDNCRKIFEMTRFEDRFELHADVQAALKSIN